MGIAPAQVDDFFQVRLKFRKVIGSPGFHPILKTGGGCLGELGHQIRWNARLLFILSPGDTNQGGIGGIRAKLFGIRGQIFQQPANLRRGKLSVRQAFQRAEGMPTILAPPGGM